MGPDDEFYCVLGVDRKTIDVFETQEPVAPPKPLCTLVRKEGGLLMLFPGPKIPAPE